MTGRAEVYEAPRSAGVALTLSQACGDWKGEHERQLGEMQGSSHDEPALQINLGHSFPSQDRVTTYSPSESAK